MVFTPKNRTQVCNSCHFARNTKVVSFVKWYSSKRIENLYLATWFKLCSSPRTAFLRGEFTAWCSITKHCEFAKRVFKPKNSIAMCVSTWFVYALQVARSKNGIQVEELNNDRKPKCKMVFKFKKSNEPQPRVKGVKPKTKQAFKFKN